jgi:hypothetical protein
MVMKITSTGNVASCVVLFLAVTLSTTRAAAQAGYVSVQVTNAGTIDGVVKWTGPIPKIPELPITKNKEVCDPESRKTRDLERLLIDSSGGVANTVVHLKDIAAGKPMDLPSVRQHLDQRECRYVPHILLVPEGSALQIRSSDPILHTVHMAGAAANNIPFPFQDQDIAVPMRRQGLVDLKCNAGHVWMNAEILVVKHPYYAVTDEHGLFKLTDVPAGEYQIEAWHEGWEILREETVLDVAAQVQVRRPIYSDPKTWAKKVTVRTGETSHVNFTISAAP